MKKVRFLNQSLQVWRQFANQKRPGKPKSATAKALGVQLPSKLLALADEVIE
jgi:hypothetical protein